MTRPVVRRSELLRVRRSGIALLAAAAALLVATPDAHAQLHYTTFVSGSDLFTTLGNNATIGFAYGVDKFVGSVYFGPSNAQLYATNLDGTNVRTFGTPIPGATGEMYVTSSLGLGGFAARDVYVGSEADGTVHKVTADGSAVSLFTSLPTGGGEHVRSIAFDPYGLYGNEMIVATNLGHVFQVTSGGVATLLTSTGEDTEGLSFAPDDFGPYAKGSLVVASEGGLGTLREIDPVTGAIHVVATVPSAEMVSFVPLNLGASGNPVEGFYAAAYPFNIQKVTAAQFLPYLGDIVVTGETTHDVTDVHFNSVTHLFETEIISHGFTVDGFPGQPEDGIFVTADIVKITGTPEPATLALLVPGVLALGVAARRRKAKK